VISTMGPQPTISFETRVLELAREIEPDYGKLVRWFCEDPIAELGCQTARELVAAGQEALVETYLLAIVEKERQP
jgi:hypothetical protein